MLKEPNGIGCLQKAATATPLDIWPARLLENDDETRDVFGCPLMLIRWAPMADYQLQLLPHHIGMLLS